MSASMMPQSDVRSKGGNPNTKGFFSHDRPNSLQPKGDLRMSHGSNASVEPALHLGPMSTQQRAIFGKKEGLFALTRRLGGQQPSVSSPALLTFELSEISRSSPEDR
ncbi:hypothetical protein VTI74DRAFT_53 [Chaetomium olivicolor]